jgi:Mn2+/Fe2+ NRAMP family transporter
MNEDLVEHLLGEVVVTRQQFTTATEAFTTATEAFNDATKHIKWNRINTIIQYVLISVVVLMLGAGAVYYTSEKKASCVRGNDLRLDITSSLDSNAAAIGFAIAIVSAAPDEKFKEYMEVYDDQPKPKVLELREC